MGKHAPFYALACTIEHTIEVHFVKSMISLNAHVSIYFRFIYRVDKANIIQNISYII